MKYIFTINLFKIQMFMYTIFYKKYKFIWDKNVYLR
jgi:hypothetical protein